MEPPSRKRRKVDAAGIWNPQHRPQSRWLGAPTQPAPAREAARLRAAKSLRSKLHRMCVAHGAERAPVLAFERWLANAALEAGSADPLLPSAPCAEANRLLCADLERVGVAEAGAVVSALSEACCKACTKVSSVQDGGAVVQVDTQGGCSRLSLSGAKGYLQLNTVHLYKLQALWQRQQQQQQQKVAAIPEATPAAELRKCTACNQPKARGGYSRTQWQNGKSRKCMQCVEPPSVQPAALDAQFEACLYCMVARYEALGGSGYQAALTERGFDVLLELLEVTHEAFASPLNCRYSSFCSAFGDTDCWFGSVGSFFDFYPVEGSFEMNPPFVPATMDRAVVHLNGLLQQATGPLSFVVIVPAWTNLSFWSKLESDPHSQHEPVLIPAADHQFCDGAQHQRSKHERHRVSSFDTGIFFLQNQLATTRWPVTDRMIDQLKSAMSLESTQSLAQLEQNYRSGVKATSWKRNAP